MLTDPENTTDQRRLARLAWQLMSRGMLHDAVKLFRERKYARGGRQAVRVAEGTTRFWLALTVSSRQRFRPRAAGGPSSSER